MTGRRVAIDTIAIAAIAAFDISLTTTPTSDFDGVSEVLDYIRVSKGLGKPDYQVVHINSEYADQVGDHDPQVVRLKP